MSFQELKYTGKLANKRILVLGGTSGIGFCVAEAAIEHGAQVMLSSSNPTKLETAAARLCTAYPELLAKNPVVTVPCDLSDSANLERNLTGLLETVTKSGKLNHIVFTAGNRLNFPALSDLTVDAIHQAGLVRFTAPLILAKLVPKYMDLSVENSFTLTGGSSTHKPSPRWAFMSGWGGAIEGLTRGLAVDLKPLRVNMVSPGAVQTELFSGLASEAMLENFRKTSTTGTVGTPQDVAEAYIYVMKDRFTTGGIVESNGGRLLV